MAGWGKLPPQKKSNHGLVLTRSDVISGGEMSIVHKLNVYLGDLAGLWRGQDTLLPRGELTSRSMSGPLSRMERTVQRSLGIHVCWERLAPGGTAESGVWG